MHYGRCCGERQEEPLAPWSLVCVRDVWGLVVGWVLGMYSCPASLGISGEGGARYAQSSHVAPGS